MCYSCIHDNDGMEQLQVYEDLERNSYKKIYSFINSSDLINKTLNQIYNGTKSPTECFIRYEDLSPDWNTRPDCDKIRQILKEELYRFLPNDFSLKISIQDLSTGRFLSKSYGILVDKCRFRIIISGSYT